MGGRSSSTTTVTKTVYKAPPAPPAIQVITPGNVSSVPALDSIGSTRIASPLPDLPAAIIRYSSPPNAWTTVPFVPTLVPGMPVIRPATPRNAEANVDIAAAQTSRDAVCEEILNDPTIGSQDWTITGNGAATRFRFPVTGAPSGVTVVNLSSGQALSTSTYSVTVRGDSFSWLVFDTAPSDGVGYRVSFFVGDSGVIRTVRSNNWNSWLTQIREIENRIARVKDSVGGTYSTNRYVGGNRTASWNIGDPTLIGDAEQAVADLKSAIKRPGMKMNVGEIAGICDYLNSQLEKIQNNLSRNEYIGGIRNCNTPQNPYRNTDSDIAGRIYDNDVRYNYFTGSDNCASYSPPNSRVSSAVCYFKRYDNISGRYYYTTGR